MTTEEKKMRSWPSYNRRASAMKTLVEMMDGATPEQCNALSVAQEAKEALRRKRG